jgi:hypothetical protein
VFAALGAPAFASDDCPRAPREQWRPEAEARAATAAMGYRVIRVEAAACYEVRATDRRGKAVELKFNPTDMKLVSRRLIGRSELAAR